MEIIQSLIKPVDSYIKQTGARKGYRRTQRPHLPRTLNSETSWYTLKSVKGHPIIGVTLGPYGKVERRCVQMIRDVIGHIFRAQTKTLRTIFSQIPLNSICVSVACTNFFVGSHCHQFLKPEESSDNNFSWSYQMHSANIQTCHYKEGNQEYLAGIIYYPVEKGRAKCIKNDSGLIQHLWLSREIYPMCDRAETELYKTSRRYGRHCSQAGRRVLVDASHIITQHVEYDYKSHASITMSCTECELDDTNYLKKRAMEIRAAVENPHHTPVPPPPSAPNPDPLQKLQDLITLYGQEPHILVFNRATGQLLDESRWPKMRDLEYFLVENQECNVHINSALQAHLVLRDGMKNRIGKGAVEVEEDTERGIEEEEPEEDPEDDPEEVEDDETVEDLITIYSPRGEPNDERLQDASFPDMAALSSTKMRELGLSDLDLDVFETFLPTNTMTPSTSSPEEQGPSKPHSTYRLDMEYIDNC